MHKGYGSIILEEFADQILSSHFNYCLIDPFTNNQRAIRAFEKAGFKVVNQFQTHETTWMIKKLNPSGV
ncbi:MAG: hypothetical protein H0U75_08085 [Legionella sp.]|nr:hypothetical protein [Legionella sp.]